MNTKLLKQKILDLAIRGKLVPQDPNDEPASELLKRIRAEKEKLIAEGKIKRSKKTGDKPHYENENVPFEVPSCWEFCSVEEIFDLNPKNNVDENEIVGFIPMELVSAGFGYSHTYEKRKWSEVKKGYCHFQNGDIGIAKISPCFENRKSTIFYDLPNNAGAGTTELVILRGRQVCKEFYLYLFKTSWYINEGTKYFKGVVGQQRVHKDIFTILQIPLPPIKEQHRIVAAIEKWFLLIDELESNKADLQEIVKQTKSKVLDLAIHGKLVPQDPNDELAVELLKRINPNATICDTSHYGNLPTNWSISTMSDLCRIIDGEKQSNINRIYLDVKYLRGKSDGEYLMSGKFVPANSTVILVDGENSGEIFTTTIDGYQGSTFKILGISKEMYKPFVLYVIMSYQKQLRENKVGSAIPHLNKKLFREIVVEVPPYEEQKRIVAKIDELISFFDSILLEL